MADHQASVISLAEWLHDLQVTLAISITAPHGSLLVLDCAHGAHVMPVLNCRGLCLCSQGLLVASNENIYFVRCSDRSFLKTIRFSPGSCDVHDIALRNDSILFCATRFNCIATLAAGRFDTIWRPRWIDRNKDDCCHLNGMALRDDGSIAYATCAAMSNIPLGWRSARVNGGIVVDVGSDDIVCGGLSMPHSPRLYQGRLWLLNSGTGELGTVDVHAGRFEPVAFCGGFARGLAFFDRYAIVAISSGRSHRFNGFAVQRRSGHDDTCRLLIVDTITGAIVCEERIGDEDSEAYEIVVVNRGDAGDG